MHTICKWSQNITNMFFQTKETTHCPCIAKIRFNINCNYIDNIMYKGGTHPNCSITKTDKILKKIEKLSGGPLLIVCWMDEIWGYFVITILPKFVKRSPKFNFLVYLSGSNQPIPSSSFSLYISINIGYSIQDAPKTALLDFEIETFWTQKLPCSFNPLKILDLTTLLTISYMAYKWC